MIFFKKNICEMQAQKNKLVGAVQLFCKIYRTYRQSRRTYFLLKCAYGKILVQKKPVKPGFSRKTMPHRIKDQISQLISKWQLDFVRYHKAT